MAGIAEHVAEEIIVSTGSGRVRGRVARAGPASTIVGDVAQFLGIPYAAAPFGPHRFRAPAPVEPWRGIRDALEFGPTAPKGGYRPPLDQLLPDPDVAGDECLNLNVWAPSPPRHGLPVMVWIHGGSFRNGSNAVPVYDGQPFARDGVVLVSVNYRLGVEGFAVFPDAPSNRGLLDLVAALRWVRANISSFGGHPDRVTVFGESAGAIAIGALMVSPLAAGLFRRAVMQSGPPAAVTPQVGRRVTERIAKRLRVAATAAAFAAADRSALLAAQIAVTTGGNPLSGATGFAVVVDGDVVPAHPLTALRSGTSLERDLLVGYNRDEYRLWFVPTGLVDRITWLTLRLALAKFRVKWRVAKAYRANRPLAKPGEILGCVATDMLMRVPINRIAESRGANTFMYEFAWSTPVQDLGACHALEIGFVFDTLDRPETVALTGPDAPRVLAAAMHGAWISFASCGDPGWPAYGPDRTVARFDLPGPTPVNAPSDDELSLWP